MKYLSLLALCSILLALPACKDNGCCRKSTTTTTANDKVVDKEDVEFEEEEIVKVMNNK